MLFCFDESGTFSIPAEQETHAVAVVLGIAVSDLVRGSLYNAYDHFAAGLSASEKVAGEPKGRLLTEDSLSRFCELLAQFDGLSVCPVTLDLGHLAAWKHRDAQLDRMRDALFQHAAAMQYTTAGDQLRLLGRQVANLSLEQFLRVLSLSICFRETLQHSILFISDRGHELSWEAVRFEIDRVSTRGGGREERVFSFMVLSWLTTWSHERPFETIREIHTADHPFVRNFDRADGIDIGRLIRNKVHWVDSRDSRGIQIADIAAAIVYRAAMDLDDRRSSVSLYGALMRSSHYGHMRGPGLFSPSETMNDHVSMKYAVLSAAMRRGD